MKANVEKIKNIIKKAEVLNDDVENLANDLDLQDQGIDSLDMANICLMCEEEFGVKIPDEDLDKVKTINDLVNYINEKLSK
jgi:acyl carrier protein